ncbi:MAG: outer membrane beta-barrel protein, partial [Nevskiaceae bacterium]|nr:outer membrane beta-barrel protein [Nevskiaceae bacterium]
MNRKAIFTGIFATLAAGAALAEQPSSGPYLGLLAGQTHASAKINDEDFGSFRFSTNAFTWGALAGWQFNQNFGAELSYLKPNTLAHVDSLKLKADAITGSIVGTLPIGDIWSVHARIGAAYTTT